MLECITAANPAPSLKELGQGLLLLDPTEAAGLPHRCVGQAGLIVGGWMRKKTSTHSPNGTHAQDPRLAHAAAGQHCPFLRRRRPAIPLLGHGVNGVRRRLDPGAAGPDAGPRGQGRTQGRREAPAALPADIDGDLPHRVPLLFQQRRERRAAALPRPALLAGEPPGAPTGLAWPGSACRAPPSLPLRCLRACILGCINPRPPLPLSEQMSWHVPTGAEVAAAVALLKRFVVPALEALEQGAQAGLGSSGGSKAVAGGSASAKV